MSNVLLHSFSSLLDPTLPHLVILYLLISDIGIKHFSSTVFPLCHREALLAEMGVAIREDGGTLGVFSPKKVQ